MSTLKFSSEQGFDIPSPKQTPSDIVGRSRLYPYYAGFSMRFAKACIEDNLHGKHGSVLDPWNGGGTTTQAAADAGVRGFGIDINPIPLLAARARLVAEEDLGEVSEFLDHIKEIQPRELPDNNDPLASWLKPAGAGAFRTIEEEIRHFFSVNPARPLIERSAPCFALTVLCTTLAKILRPRSSSNPTWSKLPKSDSDKIKVTSSRVFAKFIENGSQLLAEVKEENLVSGLPGDLCSLQVGSSANIKLPDSSIDLIVTSPPYCTRIDYAVSSAPHLALIGIDQKSGLRELRDRMTGTSTIRENVPEVISAWGETCCEFLSKVASHESKASKTYYLKNHLQYFSDISKSFFECSRVLSGSGTCVVVVQDSYYKDLHNDLPQIVSEMMRGAGLELCDRKDFDVVKSMASVNTKAAKYKATRQNTESVLVFRK